MIFGERKWGTWQLPRQNFKIFLLSYIQSKNIKLKKEKENNPDNSQNKHIYRYLTILCMMF